MPVMVGDVRYLDHTSQMSVPAPTTLRQQHSIHSSLGTPPRHRRSFRPRQGRHKRSVFNHNLCGNSGQRYPEQSPRRFSSAPPESTTDRRPRALAAVAGTGGRRGGAEEEMQSAQRVRQARLCIQIIACCYADTPANCSFADVSGKWTFYESERNKYKHENCSAFEAIRKIKIDLQYPNIAKDEFGNFGTWTMVYNQGFEVTVNERTYFAWSYYIKDGPNVTSFCDKTSAGWSHDVTLRHWACFYGRKQRPMPLKVHRDPFHSLLLESSGPTHQDFSNLVDEINRKQNKWEAAVHEPFLTKTHAELLKIRGGKMSWLAHRPQPVPPTQELMEKVAGLPQSFDWRNLGGINYVSPIRNQAICGSCYAFSSMGMLEARVRVQTNNTQTPIFSTQDIVSCSELSQGCEGGFPYLVAGRYGKDFGVVPEQCNPYQGHDGPCTRDTCYRHYTARYSYIGGYYGGCNEYAMQLALFQGGPISVAFEVHQDFMSYKGGIYHYTGVGSPSFNPFVLVNHAVLVVGYGVDGETGEKYWIVKNSWGESWGENGYFRIRRGVNEVGIESIAVQATPIP
ncbi:Cathepsin L-like proteinase [Gryllus bimaculatus]|nr:Cathepsin L-like proteinase [Gryllus bimaculatus]